MNSISSIALTKVENEPMCDGLNQDSLRAAGGLRARCPTANRISATTDITTSMVASRPSSAVWIRADSSMPR